MINFQQLIYSLKRQYGTQLDIYRETDKNPDILTGRVKSNTVKYPIRRCVVLPSAIIIDTPFLRHANLLFRNSGQFIFDTRHIIIDSRDISIEPQALKDYIVYKHERYDLKEVEKIDNNNKILGYHITMIKAVKELAYEQYNLILSDRMTFGDNYLVDIDDLSNRIEIDLVFGDILELTDLYELDRITLRDKIIYNDLFESNYQTIRNNLSLIDQYNYSWFFEIDDTLEFTETITIKRKYNYPLLFELDDSLELDDSFVIAG